MMDHKAVRFELKQLGDSGEFVGLAAAFDNIDLGGDIISRGAFTKTISEKARVPILLGHDVNAIIGTGDLRETAQGLEVHGQLVLADNPPAQRAYSLMKAHALSGLSIGYDATRSIMKSAARHLTEIKVWEVSLTPFPMNEAAQITAVKTVVPDHREELAAINSLRATIARAMR